MSTVPLIVTPEAAALVASLGMQEEMGRMVHRRVQLLTPIRLAERESRHFAVNAGRNSRQDNGLCTVIDEG